MSEPIRSTSSARLLYVYGISLVASVGGFLYGYDLVIISGAILFLDTHFELDAMMRGVLVSSAVLGAISGPVMGMWFADRIGRRKTMMAAAIFFAVSTLGCSLATTVWGLCIWRFLGGIGVGLAMMSSPIYIAELSPPDLRGRLVNVNQLSNVIGINMAVIVSYFFSFEGDWRWMFASQGVPVLLLMAGLFLIPESPRWLVAQKREDEAYRVLEKVNGEEIARKELSEIKETNLKEEGSFRELFSGGNKRALIIATILLIFSQVNGVNMILLYAPTILAEAGISVGSHAILGAIPVYLFILICTLLAFPLIRKFSRRGLLISSVSGMAAGHLLMALIVQAGLPPMAILLPMLIGTGSFTLGFAPLTWIIVSEIFPNRVRSKAMAIVCFFLYASSFLITLAFPVLTDIFTTAFGNSAGMYVFFALVCLSCVAFSWKFLPETKGIILERAGDIWRGH